MPTNNNNHQQRKGATGNTKSNGNKRSVSRAAVTGAAIAVAAVGCCSLHGGGGGGMNGGNMMLPIPHYASAEVFDQDKFDKQRSMNTMGMANQMGMGMGKDPHSTGGGNGGTINMDLYQGVLRLSDNACESVMFPTINSTHAHRPFFIMLYSPTCLHCQELMPHFNGVGIEAMYGVGYGSYDEENRWRVPQQHEAVEKVRAIIAARTKVKEAREAEQKQKLEEAKKKKEEAANSGGGGSTVDDELDAALAEDNEEATTIDPATAAALAEEEAEDRYYWNLLASIERDPRAIVRDAHNRNPHAPQFAAVNMVDNPRLRELFASKSLPAFVYTIGGHAYPYQGSVSAEGFARMAGLLTDAHRYNNPPQPIMIPKRRFPMPTNNTSSSTDTDTTAETKGKETAKGTADSTTTVAASDDRNKKQKKKPIPINDRYKAPPLSIPIADISSVDKFIPFWETLTRQDTVLNPMGARAADGLNETDPTATYFPSPITNLGVAPPLFVVCQPPTAFEGEEYTSFFTATDGAADGTDEEDSRSGASKATTTTTATRPYKVASDQIDYNMNYLRHSKELGKAWATVHETHKRQEKRDRAAAGGGADDAAEDDDEDAEIALSATAASLGGGGGGGLGNNRNTASTEDGEKSAAEDAAETAAAVADALDEANRNLRNHLIPNAVRRPAFATFVESVFTVGRTKFAALQVTPDDVAAVSKKDSKPTVPPTASRYGMPNIDDANTEARTAAEKQLTKDELLSTYAQTPANVFAALRDACAAAYSPTMARKPSQGPNGEVLLLYSTDRAMKPIYYHGYADGFNNNNLNKKRWAGDGVAEVGAGDDTTTKVVLDMPLPMIEKKKKTTPLVSRRRVGDDDDNDEDDDDETAAKKKGDTSKKGDAASTTTTTNTSPPPQVTIPVTKLNGQNINEDAMLKTRIEPLTSVIRSCSFRTSRSLALWVWENSYNLIEYGSNDVLGQLPRRTQLGVLVLDKPLGAVAENRQTLMEIFGYDVLSAEEKKERQLAEVEEEKRLKKERDEELKRKRKEAEEERKRKEAEKRKKQKAAAAAKKKSSKKKKGKRAEPSGHGDDEDDDDDEYISDEDEDEDDDEEEEAEAAASAEAKKKKKERITTPVASLHNISHYYPGLNWLSRKRFLAYRTKHRASIESGVSVAALQADNRWPIQPPQGMKVVSLSQTDFDAAGWQSRWSTVAPMQILIVSAVDHHEWLSRLGVSAPQHQQKEREAREAEAKKQRQEQQKKADEEAKKAKTTKGGSAASGGKKTEDSSSSTIRPLPSAPYFFAFDAINNRMATLDDWLVNSKKTVLDEGERRWKDGTAAADHTTPMTSTTGRVHTIPPRFEPKSGLALHLIDQFMDEFLSIPPPATGGRNDNVDGGDATTKDDATDVIKKRSVDEYFYKTVNTTIPLLGSERVSNNATTAATNATATSANSTASKGTTKKDTVTTDDKANKDDAETSTNTRRKTTATADGDEAATSKTKGVKGDAAKDTTTAEKSKKEATTDDSATKKQSATTTAAEEKKKKESTTGTTTKKAGTTDAVDSTTTKNTKEAKSDDEAASKGKASTATASSSTTTPKKDEATTATATAAQQQQIQKIPKRCGGKPCADDEKDEDGETKKESKEEKPATATAVDAATADAPSAVDADDDMVAPSPTAADSAAATSNTPRAPSRLKIKHLTYSAAFVSALVEYFPPADHLLRLCGDDSFLFVVMSGISIVGILAVIMSLFGVKGSTDDDDDEAGTKAPPKKKGTTATNNKAVTSSSPTKKTTNNSPTAAAGQKGGANNKSAAAGSVSPNTQYTDSPQGPSPATDSPNN